MRWTHHESAHYTVLSPILILSYNIAAMMVSYFRKAVTTTQLQIIVRCYKLNTVTTMLWPAFCHASYITSSCYIPPLIVPYFKVTFRTRGQDCRVAFVIQVRCITAWLVLRFTIFVIHCLILWSALQGNINCKLQWSINLRFWYLAGEYISDWRLQGLRWRKMKY